MCAQTKAPVNEERVRHYSKLLDENRDELEGLPYQGAFEFLAGQNEEVPAIWELIASGDVTEKHLKEASEIIAQYPYESKEELLEARRRQKTYAALFDEPIRFDKYDVRFAKDLIKKINDGNLISKEQFQYLQYFVFRYREQLKDKLIYEEEGSDRLYDLLGEDPRAALDQIFQESKVAYEEVNPRQ